MKTLTTNQKLQVMRAILIAQILCAAFFIFDALADVTGLEAQLPFSEVHWVEFLVSAGLLASIFISIRLLLHLDSERKRADQALALAKGAFGQVVSQRMEQWGLTASEKDVALFAIKGLDTADIASARGSAVGTVKAQLTSVYRKANVTNRAQLVSLFVDELME